MPQDLSDDELDELADRLAATPQPLQPLDVPMLDGYLAGVLVQPRRVPVDEWLPPVFDLEGRALPGDVDGQWLSRTRALIERRRDALDAVLAQDGGFDPVLVDAQALPPVSEYEPVQSPVSRVLAPWAGGFHWAQECFGDLQRLGDDAVGPALLRIYRHLPPLDDAEKQRFAALEREHPVRGLDAGIEDLVAATAELWDLTADRRYAVATIRRAAPKVGRNDPCPCGSGRKFKLCHGR
jgi:uncharacterized protein